MISPQAKAKLTWNCRRGMLELDLVLNQFLKHLDNLKDSEVNSFEQLLTCTDPELYGWLIGNEPVTDKELESIVQLIKFHYNPK